MHRRTFLSLTAGALSGFVLDPERLLWRPGAKTFFLPTPRMKTWEVGTVLRLDPVKGWTLMHGPLVPGTVLGVWDGTQVETHGVMFARVGVS